MFFFSSSFTLVYFLLGLAAQASFSLASPVQKRQVDFYDPALGGGSMLNKATASLGEPLNVIISGLSSPAVLTTDGIVNYARAIGFSVECLGLHIGIPQTANLGDGNGDVPQNMLLRQAYGVPSIGTCWESLVGGNHFRVYRQNGPKANSDAIFLAVSQEMDSPIHHHMITKNGYNLGRDNLVKAALGVHTYGKYTYRTTARNITGLMSAGAQGVNHNISQDGIVTLLTVQVV